MLKNKSGSDWWRAPRVDGAIRLREKFGRVAELVFLSQRLMLILLMGRYGWSVSLQGERTFGCDQVVVATESYVEVDGGEKEKLYDGKEAISNVSSSEHVTDDKFADVKPRINVSEANGMASIPYSHQILVDH